MESLSLIKSLAEANGFTTSECRNYLTFVREDIFITIKKEEFVDCLEKRRQAVLTEKAAVRPIAEYMAPKI